MTFLCLYQECESELTDSEEKLSDLKMLTQSLRPRGITYEKPVNTLEIQYNTALSNVKVSSTILLDIMCTISDKMTQCQDACI